MVPTVRRFVARRGPSFAQAAAKAPPVSCSVSRSLVSTWREPAVQNIAPKSIRPRLAAALAAMVAVLGAAAGPARAGTISVGVTIKGAGTVFDGDFYACESRVQGN